MKRRVGRELSDGDLMPFDVKVVSPPPRYLGRFRLDPRTHCGDILDHGGQSYTVRQVRMRFQFRNGGVRVTKKTLDVKSLARKAIETFLEQTLRNSK